MRRVLGVLGFLVLSLAAGGFDTAIAAEKLKVVATFSILGDLAQRVAGDHATVISLVGPDGDAHAFEPGPRESGTLAEADVLVANGLGFEPWIERLSEAAGFRGTLVVATDGVTPLPASHEEEAGAEGAGDDHDHGAFDPHAFQDLANGRIYVANIAKGLSAADPAHATDYQANAQRLAADMAALDASLKDEFASIPAAHRRVLTSHDAFAYFSRAYGIEFVSIHGVSTEAEPSARDLAKIIEQARDGKIKAIFLENMADPRLAETVAGESGIRIGGQLYADALSPESGPAADYLSLFRYNAGQLLAALR